MLEAILRAAGLRALAVGNVGVLDHRRGGRGRAVRRARRRGVELAAALVAPSIAPGGRRAAEPGARSPRLARVDRRTYAAAKAAVWFGAGRRSATPTTRWWSQLLATAPGEQVSFTLDEPAPGSSACVDGHARRRARSATTTSCWPPRRGRPSGRRAQRRQRARRRGARPRRTASPAEAIAAGLRAFVPDPHRNQLVADARRRRLGRRQQGDQPARRARARCSPTTAIVWIAGGQLKGAPVDDLVAEVAPRLRRRRAARRRPRGHRRRVARHAPDVPVIEVDDDTTMEPCWRWCAPRPGWRARVTPCCSPRRRPPTTCSPATPRADARSPPRSARCSGMSVRRAARRACRGRAARVRASRRRSASSTGPYASVQLLLLAAAGLLGFGILMAVSTTIAASHDDDGGRRLDLDAGDQGGRVRRDRPAAVLVRDAAVAARLPRARLPDAGPRRSSRWSPCSCRASASACTARAAGSTSARCSCSRPSSRRSACCCGAATCSRASSSSARCAGPGTCSCRSCPGFALVAALVMLEPDLGTTLLLHADPARPAVDGRHADALLRLVRRRLVARRGDARSRSPSRTGWQRLTSFTAPVQGRAGLRLPHRRGPVRARARAASSASGSAQGTSKYGWVPNANSDYVFAIIGEELGLLGCARRARAVRRCSPTPACASRGAAPTRSCGWSPARRRSGSAARR